MLNIRQKPPATARPPAVPRSSSPAPPYAPPKGFKPVDLPESASRLKELFTPSRLAGKQLWHITAPAGLPMQNVLRLSPELLRRKEIDVRHNNVEYALRRAMLEDIGNCKVLVPSQAGFVDACGMEADRVLSQRLLQGV